jgi:glycosyltransferase involved in cell wall biosynthesis
MKFFLLASYPDSIVDFRGPLIAALQASGLQVHVAAPDVPEGSALRALLESKGLTVHNVPLHRTGLNPLADVLLLFHLWRLMARLRPDYFLGYTVKPVVYGLLAAWLAGVPRRFALITGLGYAFQASRGRSGLRLLVQRLYAGALSRAQGVFFQNPDDHALFLSKKILPAHLHSVVVNGSGIDLEQYTVAPLPSGGIRYLLIARLLGDKGVREYIEAARTILKKYPDTQFDLVGWMQYLRVN